MLEMPLICNKDGFHHSVLPTLFPRLTVRLKGSVTQQVRMLEEGFGGLGTETAEVGGWRDVQCRSGEVMADRRGGRRLYYLKGSTKINDT